MHLANFKLSNIITCSVFCVEYFVQCRQKAGSEIQFVKFWKYLKLENRQGYMLLPTLVRLLYQFPCSSFKILLVGLISLISLEK